MLSPRRTRKAPDKESPMADNHGNTPAAWTAVMIGLAGFVVGGIGLMVESMVTFWVGVALAPVAILVGYVMARMGYHTSH
jgi:predicted lipid-binding transport protein (Tim44 family)